MDELQRLRVNTKLLELDVRLNPVACSGPDYRLTLVHMLPNLRRLGNLVIIGVQFYSVYWCDTDV